METKIVKVTDKGQISLPISIRESAGIVKGDELLMIKSGRTILLEKLKTSDFRDLLKHSEKVAEKLWGNKEN
ncbi:MAG: AbrB/MazE/SpoVT family DNA-binding domain-containing protein, partial [Nanoarchaeota archaeon]